MPQSIESVKRPQFFALGSVAVILGLLYFAREVLIPLALAILFAFLLTPLVTRLERRLGRVASTLSVVVAALALFVVFGWIVEQRFVQIVEELPQYRTSIRNKYEGFTRSGGVVEKFRNEIKESMTETPATQPATQPAAGSGHLTTLPSPLPGVAVIAAPVAAPRPTPDNPLPVRIFPSVPQPLEVIGEYLGRFLSPAATAALVIVFVIFMLLGREDLRDRVIRLVGDRRLHVTTEALDDAAQRVTRFLVAQALINASYGTLVALGLWLIDLTVGGNRGGISTALLAGVVCAVLRFVPYIGPWLGAALPLGLAFAAYPGNHVFFLTLGMFVVIELVVSQAVEPKLLGSSTGIAPLAVLVAAVFWTWLWGPIGLLLSTPLTVLLVVMGKYVPQLEFLDVLLGDQPALEPPSRIYQRLIAGDDEEALELSQGYHKEMPLAAVYDKVLIPALILGERDWHQGNIDDARHVAVRQGFRDIVETLGDDQRAADKASAEEAAKDLAAAAPDAQRDPSPPKSAAGDAVKVLCIPAQDEADEIVGLMLGQLLERRGYQVSAAGSATLASEMVERINKDGTDVVVVSALPPKAGIHARYLLKRLASVHPMLRIVVGLWMATRESDKVKVAQAGQVAPATSLDEAQNQLDQFALLVRSNAEKGAVPA
jgi:predicted PurR-regulated permease PerM